MSARKTTKMRADKIKYSEPFKGDKGNFGWPARFDKDGRGYIGITQFENENGVVTDRVLLSPEQAKHLTAFIRR
jgi:hypothetical protein